MAKMVKINIGTSFDTEETVFNAETTTVETAFRSAGVSISNAIITHNSKRVNDPNLTLDQLNMRDGDLLTANTKTVGA